MNAIIRTEPLAALRQGLHTSVSQVKAFQTCGKRYEIQYVRGVPPSHRPIALSFGSAVHAALETFYERLRDTGEKPPVEELQAAFADRMDVEMADASIPIRFDDGQDAGTVKGQGIAMLANYHQKGFVPDWVIAVEQPFAVDLADPETGQVLDIPLIGAIDLVAEHQGRVVLVEHKTAARRFDAIRLRHDIQPSSYLFAAKSLQLAGATTAFNLLLKGKGTPTEYIPLSRTRADEIEALETITAVLRAIESQIFFRTRGWACGDCGFKRACGG